MDNRTEKKALRGLYLEKRDNTSSDYLQIAGKRIHKKLKTLKHFRDAKKIGAYHPIGSEVPTQDIIQELYSAGKDVLFPRVTHDRMDFYHVCDFSCLQKSGLGIMEPKDGCKEENCLDVILVPSVCVSPGGVRLGYGRGFYDRFLGEFGTNTVTLVLEKQLVQNIPRSDHDVLVDWIVTEDRVIRTRCES